MMFVSSLYDDIDICNSNADGVSGKGSVNVVHNGGMDMHIKIKNMEDSYEIWNRRKGTCAGNQRFSG